MLSKKRTNFTQEISKCEPFLSKLHDILSLKEYSPIIRWNNDGKKIIITDVNKLSEIILPKFYKHRNYSSFVRQLNIYNFHKCKGISELGEEFEHKEFNKKSTKEDIKQIIRKNKKEKKNFSNSENLIKILIKKQEENEKNQLELKNEINEIKKINQELKNEIMNKNNELENKNEYLSKLRKLFTFVMISVMNEKRGKKEEKDINELINVFNEDKNNTKESTKNKNVDNKVDFPSSGDDVVFNDGDNGLNEISSLNNDLGLFSKNESKIYFNLDKDAFYDKNYFDSFYLNKSDF